MKRFQRYLLCYAILTLLLGAGIGPAGAGATEPHLLQMEVRLMALINEARDNPLETAARLGLDPEKVLADLPELRHILIAGLPPLAHDDILTAAARAHTLDMLVNDFYGNSSSDGTGSEARLRGWGYPVGKSGEALGVVGFINFIESNRAVNRIFNGLFKDELDPARVRPRLILDPDLMDAGIGFGTGIMTLGAERYNVYLATCDFGVPEEFYARGIERELLNLINQARAKPLAMARAVGLKPAEVLAALPEMADVLTQGLAPLAFEDRLRRSAVRHARDMVERGYFAESTPEGTTPGERMAAVGYDAAAAGARIASIGTPGALGQDELAWQLFASLYKETLDPQRVGRRWLLDPDVRDAGLCMQTLPLVDESESLTGTYGLLLVDLAEPLTAPDPSLSVVVYRDRDANGLFGLGEGVENVSVTAKGNGKIHEWHTDAAGGTLRQLPPGAYAVTVHRNGLFWSGNLVLDKKNMGLWFRLAPSE